MIELLIHLFHVTLDTVVDVLPIVSIIFGFQFLVIRKKIPNLKDFYISLDVESTSETNMKADVVIHDQKGNIYSRAFGAEVTVSPTLDSMFTAK